MDGLRTDLPILETIGAYRLLKHLGANGPVQVYLARGEGSGRPSGDVVLKIVSGLADNDTKRIEELRREAPAFCKLSHPAVIRTYEFFEHQNSLVFVLEHVDGMSLAELSVTGAPKEGRAFSDDAVFHAAISICDALAHAHGKPDAQGKSSPVVHKGMSPSKARVARDGMVKLGGFGLIQPFGVSVDRKGGGLRWESAYLAPEQVLGQPSSPKVDVYATGLILWELLTGRSSAMVVPKDPFALPTAMRAMAERILDPLAKLRPDLPRALSAAVDAALIPSPEKRTIGCAELAQEIRKHGRISRGKEELRAKVQMALPGAESPPPQKAPVPASTKATPPIGTPSVDAQPPISVRRPPAPVPAPPPPRAASKAVSHPPAVPVAAAAVEPISASPIVAIGSPSRAAPPPPPPAPPPQIIPAPPTHHRPPQPLPAAVPIDSVTSATMELPAATDRPQGLVPALSAELEPSDKERAVVPGKLSRAAFALSSVLGRLRVPSDWPRSARLATSVGVPLVLAALIAMIAVGRSHRSSQQEAQLATTAARADLRSTVPATPDTASSPKVAALVQGPSAGEVRPLAGPSGQVPPAQEPSAKVAASAERQVAPAVPAAKSARAPLAPSVGGEFSPALKKRHLGHLTVHSTAPYAKVYIMFTRFGRVEEELTVPCGQRFVAIGVPPRGGRREPVWLAPGKPIFIPCGGSLTVTMNPRRVR
jgi:serine/threonine protein kinase